MTETVMTRRSLAEARALRDAGKTLTDPNAAEGPDLGAEFWANAVLAEPKARKSVHLRLDPGVYDFFVTETGGKGHIARMQAALNAYADAHR